MRARSEEATGTSAAYAAGRPAVLLPVAWGGGGLAQLLPELHREVFFGQPAAADAQHRLRTREPR